MQSQSREPISGEEEVRRAAQRCLDSPDAHLFVVGPSRSGKSTRLPIVLAALSEKKVICVQPDDRAAQCHAEWIRSSGTDSYDQKRVRVGYHKDEEDMKLHFVPDYDVTYVSSRWLYRMVVGVRFDESQRLRANMEQKKTAYYLKLRVLRRVVGDSVGFVLLDETHAQSVDQEHAYMAMRAATSGTVEAPLGFFAGTKIICTTAYLENETFLRCFGLSADEIGRRLIKIHRGLAPRPGHKVQERFIPEEQGPSPNTDYHTFAAKRANKVIRNNPQARILVLMDTLYSARNIVRQDRSLQATVKVVDLESEPDWSELARHPNGPLVVLVTASYASRIPLKGVTDVICPFFETAPVLCDKLHRVVFTGIEVSTWQLAWARNHLDPTLSRRTIHYMFRRSVHDQLEASGGARWRYADFIDVFLGAVRLTPDAFLGSEQGPMRLKVGLPTATRALDQLTTQPATIVRWGNNNLWPARWVMRPGDRSATMTKLMDRGGLERRHAYFLALLEGSMAHSDMGTSRQNFLSSVAIAMVVFDDFPILRMLSPRGATAGAVTEAFGRLGDVFRLGSVDVTGDAWVNAVVWMDMKRRGIATRSDAARIARKLRTGQIMIDEVVVWDAERKLRSLARIFGLDQRYEDALCDGSLLQRVRQLNKAFSKEYASDIHSLWTAYLFAFQFNLAYMKVDRVSVRMIDISTDRAVDYARSHMVVDLSKQADKARADGRDGFYVVCANNTELGYRSLTVMPEGVVRQITGESEFDCGSFNLRLHLILE